MYKFYRLNRLPSDLRQVKALHLNQMDRESFQIEKFIRFSQLEALKLENLESPIIQSLVELYPHLLHLEITGLQGPLPELIFRLSKLKLLSLRSFPLSYFKLKKASLSSLKVLVLNHLILESLGEEIGQLKNLVRLDISNNELKQLPASIGNLKNLNTLIFSQNLIQKIPSEWANIHLTQIKFDQNPVHTALAPSQRKLSELINSILYRFASAEEQKVYWDLFLGNWESPFLANHLKIVCKTLNASHVLLPRQASLYLWLKFPERTQHLEIPAAKVHLKGSFPLFRNYTSEEYLQNLGLVLSSEGPHTLTILGEYPGKLEGNMWQDSDHILSGTHLKVFFQAHYQRTLKAKGLSMNTQKAQKIRRLVQSDIPSNCQIGLEMAKGLGLDPLYLHHIILLYLFKEKGNQPIAEEVLRTFLPPDFYAHLQSRVQSYSLDSKFWPFKEEQITEYLQGICSHFVSGDELGTIIYQKYKKGKQFGLSFPQSFIQICQAETQNQVLKLSSQKLKQLSKGIAALNQIRILYLNHNFLEDLPTEIKALRQLRQLYLQQNQFHHFPPQLYTLKGLRKLSLAENKLQKFPRELDRLPNLVYLNLGHNPISEISEDIKVNPHLKYIYLQGNTHLNTSKSLDSLRYFFPNAQIKFK